jgi:hypothetical protein
MKPHPTHIILAATLCLSSPLAAADIKWEIGEEVYVDGQGGALPAVPSIPPGHPLVFGRGGNYAGNQKYFPVSESEGLAFSGFGTAVVPGLWTNIAGFSIMLDVTFGRLDVEQSLVMVPGVFDLRLSVVDGIPSLDFIGVREPARPLYLKTTDVGEGSRLRIVASMNASGEMKLRVNETEVAAGSLGQPPSAPVMYPDLYVGSANPEVYRRPFTGVLHSLSVTTEKK